MAISIIAIGIGALTIAMSVWLNLKIAREAKLRFGGNWREELRAKQRGSIRHSKREL